MPVDPNEPQEVVSAQWSISLDCDCPKCNDYVNLLDAADFWEGRKFEIGENGTDKTIGVGVTCPKCGHEFTVDFIY